ncbi:MAG: type II toxin-antitoxin system prevent-host-death family antitoxin, partial [Desulfitobacteriaceae bacterium]
MGAPIKRLGQDFTYHDYLSWQDEIRCELIDGNVFDMTPAPSRLHQSVLGELHALFHNYFKGKSCKIYTAPFDVRLPQAHESDEETSTVVQPDLVVVCDPKKLDDRGCKGTPDLVIEVVSPSTMRKDLKTKFHLYERAGVREYWIVHPEQQIISIFHLTAELKYGRPDTYTVPDTYSVGIFPDLNIDLTSVFPPEEPISITKNGVGDMVVMSVATYERQQALINLYTKLA